MDVLESILEAIMKVVNPQTSVGSYEPRGRQFYPDRPIRERDMTIIDMLNSAGHENVSFCICDNKLEDCPIVFASDGFCKFTGYESSEIEGRNCRFLQGPDTAKEDVDRIRRAVKEEIEASVNLLNYRKDGTPFNNEFFLSPLHGADGKLEYFIGVQCSVAKLGPGQMPSNVGWVYSNGLHA